MSIDRPGLDDRTQIDPEALAYVRPRTLKAEAAAYAAGRAEDGADVHARVWTAARNTEQVARKHGSGHWTARGGRDALTYPADAQ